MRRGVAMVVRERIDDADAPDNADTLVQARAVAESLAADGWPCMELELGTDLADWEAEVRRVRPELIFNMVESHAGVSTLACVVPALCRKLGVPCTGAEDSALMLAADKRLTRRVLAASGLPVPDGVGLEDLRHGNFPGPGTYIVKSRFEDASQGMDENAVVRVNAADELLAIMERAAKSMGGDCVAETYVEGRECNLALLSMEEETPHALPVAEMVFAPSLQGPRILHYAAKWRENSAAYAASSRCFGVAEAAELCAIGRRVWDVCGLRGYARVDFRISDRGAPLVIDVNPNPCLSPDSGFVAAAAEDGLDHAALVRCIAWDALRRAGKGVGADRG